VLEMRQHYSNYFKGYAHVKEFREKLVREESLIAIDAVFDEMKEKYMQDV